MVFAERLALLAIVREQKHSRSGDLLLALRAHPTIRWMESKEVRLFCFSQTESMRRKVFFHKLRWIRGREEGLEEGERKGVKRGRFTNDRDRDRRHHRSHRHRRHRSRHRRHDDCHHHRHRRRRHRNGGDARELR